MSHVLKLVPYYLIIKAVTTLCFITIEEKNSLSIVVGASHHTMLFGSFFFCYDRKIAVKHLK